MLPVLFLTACTQRAALPNLDDVEIATVFEELHRGLYGIYELPLDRDILHTHLARSLAHEALTRNYVEHWTSLVRMAEARTRIDIRRVDYRDVAVVGRSEKGVRVEASWSVGGVIHHASHSHARINLYRAIYTLGATPEGPRVIETRLRHAERLGDPMSSTTTDEWILDTLPEQGGFLDAADLLEAGLLDGEDK